MKTYLYDDKEYTSLLSVYRAVRKIEFLPSRMKDVKWNLDNFGEYQLSTGNKITIKPTLS